MTRLQVLFAGPHVTWQDRGRPGLMRFGVPASGPMDRAAFDIATRAAGSDLAIEVSLGGLALRAEGEVSLALAGGGFIAETEARGGSWQVLTLRAGQSLRLRPGFWGAWTYLAIAGQVELTPWLGARATHGPSGLGGGRLVTGQVLEVAAPRLLPTALLPCPVHARPRRLLRAVAGPQDRFFAPEDLAAFFAAPFVVSTAIDRMGLRLEGPALVPRGALSIPSEPLLRGSVQVNGAGQATVLMADHQTTGGYPKIATILDADLDALARLRPGEKVEFRQVSPAEALQIERADRIRRRALGS